jgi:putative hemolysin
MKLEFFRDLPPAIELGRSFVRPEYQRQYQSLLLLWQGIGHMMAAEPHYRILFGPVSVSGKYGKHSMEVIRRFLERHCGDAELRRQIKPRHRLQRCRMGDADPRAVLDAVGELDELSDWVADLEPDGEGIPVLLRQYLKLGGRIAAFNVDPDFSDVLDAMIIVDMAAVPAVQQAKYMGKVGAEYYRTHHPTTADNGTPAG